MRAPEPREEPPPARRAIARALDLEELRPVVRVAPDPRPARRPPRPHPLGVVRD